MAAVSRITSMVVAFDFWQLSIPVFHINQSRKCHVSCSDCKNQAMEITRLVSLLKPDEPEEAVISACQKLVAIFQEYPEQRAHLISQHGFIPLVEMLDVNNNRVGRTSKNSNWAWASVRKQSSFLFRFCQQM